MKALNRQELATAVNIDKLPVLVIDHADDDREYEGVTIGCAVRVKTTSKNPRYKNLTYDGQLWLEDGKYSIVGHGFGISADFGYADVMELVDASRTPIIGQGEQVVLIEHDSDLRKANAWMMEVGRVSEHCTTRCSLS